MKYRLIIFINYLYLPGETPVEAYRIYAIIDAVLPDYRFLQYHYI